MYHKVKIGQLSNPQISRLLNGHGVRVNGSNFFVLTIMKINLHHSGSPLRAFNVPSERSIVVGGSTWGMMEDI